MKKIFILLLFLVCSESYAASIVFNNKSALVWHYEQRITGELFDLTAEEIVVYHNGHSFPVEVSEDQQFAFQVTLSDSINKIWIEVDNEEQAIVSDTLRYTLGYIPSPLIKPLATISGESAVLTATVIENPYHQSLQFFWQADAQNPASSVVENMESATAEVEIPNIPGNYFYNLLVVAEEDSTWFQTLVTRTEEELQAFNMDSDYPSWMDEAIIYQITPYNFVVNGTFQDIKAKLPELQELGINTIWLQPVFKSSYRGQGYDVVDYLSLNPAFGTEADLQQLITEAKALDIRVLFDLVLNHTSIQHPYAKDIIAHGENSYYYDYYQHENDGKPYSSFYNTDENGFVFYFWEDLVNLNYENAEVQRWMLEVCKHWVRKFDIDGYRFDAIWGVNARKPSFAQKLRVELKSIKPDILLLAEDKGSAQEVFDLGFDAAYDWTVDTNWVSQWAWEYEYNENESMTAFNHPEVNKRGELMRQALFENGGNEHKLLRYLENNDLHRFINDHGLRRTKMAAALLFALPGIPMLYNGQEVGFGGHPYSTSAVFNRNWSIQATDKDGLFPYYQKLIQLHKQYPALSDTTLEALSSTPEGAMVAFHRWKGDENFVVVMNMDNTSTEAILDLRPVFPNEANPEHAQLRDVLSEITYSVGPDISNVGIAMEGYEVKWLLVEEPGEPTGVIDEKSKKELIVYPNPSDGNFTIDFPEASFNKMRIIDMIGKTVYEEQLNYTGVKHSFDIQLPSTVYLLEISNREEMIKSKIFINK